MKTTVSSSSKAQSLLAAMEKVSHSKQLAVRPQVLKYKKFVVVSFHNSSLCQSFQSELTVDSSLEVKMDSLNPSSSAEQEEPKHHEHLSKLGLLYRWILLVKYYSASSEIYYILRYYTFYLNWVLGFEYTQILKKHMLLNMQKVSKMQIKRHIFINISM